METIAVDLEAMLPNGDVERVGEMHLPFLPNIGSSIEMELHYGNQVMNEEEGPSTHFVRFHVESIIIYGHNTAKIEKWYIPCSRTASSFAVATVTAEDQNARDYLTRLASQFVA